MSNLQWFTPAEEKLALSKAPPLVSLLKESNSVDRLTAAVQKLRQVTEIPALPLSVEWKEFFTPSDFAMGGDAESKGKTVGWHLLTFVDGLPDRLQQYWKGPHLSDPWGEATLKKDFQSRVRRIVVGAHKAPDNEEGRASLDSKDGVLRLSIGYQGKAGWTAGDYSQLRSPTEEGVFGAIGGNLGKNEWSAVFKTAGINEQQHQLKLWEIRRLTYKGLCSYLQYVGELKDACKAFDSLGISLVFDADSFNSIPDSNKDKQDILDSFGQGIFEQRLNAYAKSMTAWAEAAAKKGAKVTTEFKNTIKSRLSKVTCRMSPKNASTYYEAYGKTKPTPNEVTWFEYTANTKECVIWINGPAMSAFRWPVFSGFVIYLSAAIGIDQDGNVSNLSASELKQEADNASKFLSLPDHTQYLAMCIMRAPQSANDVLSNIAKGKATDSAEQLIQSTLQEIADGKARATPDMIRNAETHLSAKGYAIPKAAKAGTSGSGITVSTSTKTAPLAAPSSPKSPSSPSKPIASAVPVTSPTAAPAAQKVGSPRSLPTTGPTSVPTAAPSSPRSGPAATPSPTKPSPAAVSVAKSVKWRTFTFTDKKAVESTLEDEKKKHQANITAANNLLNEYKKTATEAETEALSSVAGLDSTIATMIGNPAMAATVTALKNAREMTLSGSKPVVDGAKAMVKGQQDKVAGMDKEFNTIVQELQAIAKQF